jgi:regulator of nonsense transcripts 1
MHPAIAAFPNRRFYAGRLRSAPTPESRRPPPGFAWPSPDAPVAFIAVSGPETRTATYPGGASPSPAAAAASVADAGGNFSFQNRPEAEAALGIVRGLVAAGLPHADVGVISPYNGQVRLLSSLARALGGGGGSGGGSGIASSSSSSSFAAGRGRGAGRGAGRGGRGGRGGDWGGGGGPESPWASDLEVRSVDGFQGREKEVIVFSAVRSNPGRVVGFVGDPRRANVALTRARRGLIVIGDPDTLSADPVWRDWLRWAAGAGVVIDRRRGRSGGGGDGGGSDGNAGGALAAPMTLNELPAAKV